MKKILIITTVCLILLNQVSRLYMVVSYHINKADITASYCENKDKPALQCNGQCYLSKQLKEQEQQESGTSPDTKTSKETDWIISGESFHFETNIRFYLTSYSPYLLRDHYSVQSSVFHPPASSAV